ncbi:diaminopimelate epimerase [Coxiella endosymbiont of Dermacentor marginatus]|uniref:diaminopimelate epimerase n=1 Tax=Coxiella endosymbiont of Dermacentor marginatus TaxID=1656159 RepID=UPI0029C9E44A|nr:diaminopimelate epimerase [Coxiella endosymbiont of Dermacentor marginatus]
MKINFTKMHGLGNDFVVIDATKQPFQMTTPQIQKMAHRRLGIGFDQLLVIELPKSCYTVDFHFRIFNADGSEVSQCGNGACCIARYIYANQLTERNELRVSTLKDILELKIQSDDTVSVKMGIPRFNPADVPFIASKTANFYDLEIDNQKIKLGVVNIGNPHAVIPVDTIDALLVSKLSPRLSTHKCFPKGINVGFMQVINSQNIRLRVYERGAGETLSCGSGACAAMVVGRRSGLLQKRVVVEQPGGSLFIDWEGFLAPVIMTGSAATIFRGEWSD